MVCTKAVVAMVVSLSPAAGVGARGFPVNNGDAIGARTDIDEFTIDCALVCTKAVVAICVVLVPNDAVGATGVPVNTGDAAGAAPALTTSVNVNVMLPVRALNAVTAPLDVMYPFALAEPL